MNIKIKPTEQQLALLKAMGSRDTAVATEARETFAAFIGPIALKVLTKAGSASMIYTDVEFDEDDHPSFPVDLYRGKDEGEFSVWSQSIAGGLPSNQVSGMEEIKVSTYRLDGAVNWLEKYARRGRLDIAAQAVKRLTQEILVKQEVNAWTVLLKALANASTNDGSGSMVEHLVQSTTTNVLQLDDFNRLLTKARRINNSFDQGTPADFDSRGVTDLFMSPEMMQEIRSFAYQPMNTRATPNTDESTAVPLPDSIRERVFNQAGMTEIYNIMLHELLELGISRRYNTLFDDFYGGALTFATANQELIVGVDLSGDDRIVRPIARRADSGATFTVQNDDQYAKREERIGQYGSLEEGRAVLDARALCGIVIQ